MKKLGIIGLGWLGSHIAKTLSNQYEIFATTTSESKIDELKSKGYHITLIDFSDETDTSIQPWNILPELEAVIITIPFSGIRGAQISMKERQDNLIRFLSNYNGQMFLMSSTGVYPETEQDYTESDKPSQEVESESFILERFPQTNILRLAGLMGDQRLLKNYNISNLNQPVNHIHYADICKVVEKMLNNHSQSQVYNLTAPLHPSKEAVINTQKGLPYSGEAFPKGRTISTEKLISELGYEYQYPDPRYFHL